MVRLVIGLCGVTCSLYGCLHGSGDLVAPSSSPALSDPGLWMSALNTEPCASDTSYYAGTAYPLIFSYCAGSGCHDALAHQGGVQLEDRPHILQQVIPGHPMSSHLWIDGIQTAMPPSDWPQLTAAQQASIYTWILQGAAANGCNSCDTMEVGYAQQVAPIFQDYCVGCHGGAYAAGALDLTTWESRHAIALNGWLERTVKHLGPQQPMPPYPDGSFMPACAIIQLMKWRRAGAPG